MVIRNLHRRLRGAARDLEPARPRQWMFDAARWSITTPTGAIVTLSLAEYTVIAALLARPGDAVSRDDLLTALDRRDVRVYSRNLDLIVSRLRRKVARAGDRKSVGSGKRLSDLVDHRWCRTTRKK